MRTVAKAAAVLCAYALGLLSLFFGACGMAVIDAAALLRGRRARPRPRPGPARSPRVSFVVPNWNGKHLLRECLPSIQAQTFRDFEIVLVDDGSTDGSVDFLRQRFPDVRIVEHAKNLGVTRAFNTGVAAAAGEFVALVNNDVVLDPHWTDAVLAVAEADPNVWICASKLRLYGDRGRLHSAGDIYGLDCLAHNRGMGEPSKGRYETEEDVFSACAAAALYRRAMFDAIGVFDEDFWMTLEDIDIGFRTLAAGGRCRYVPSAVGNHHGSATAGVMSYANTRSTIQNSLNVIVKNLPLSILLRHAWPIAASRLSLVREFTVYGSFAGCVEGLLRSIVMLPAMLRKRCRQTRLRVLTPAEIERRLSPPIRRPTLSHLLTP